MTDVCTDTQVRQIVEEKNETRNNNNKIKADAIMSIG